jgi:putative ABC transport system permease protein
LSLLLLIGAALLFRSFVNLQSVSAGVNTKDLMSVRFSLPAARYSEPAAMAGFVQQLTRNVQTSPGVRSVSAVTILPLSGMNTRADFTIDGKPPAREDEKPAAQNRWIAPEYFRTMGIPLIAGRDFTDLDTARSQAVIIIDETLARRHFPTDTPLGKHLHVSDSGPAARDVEIVGVTGNVKHFGLEDTPINTYYSPLTQVPQPALGFVANGLNLVVRTEPRLSVSDELRRHIQSLDPDVPAATAQTMDQLIASTVAPRRFNLLLIEIFAGAALLLAAMGLYSVIAYSVVQRRNEIGIRMALGATASDVFRQMLREGVLLTISGELIGLVFAFATTRFLSGLLFQVHATDPWTFAVISAILAVTALIACYVPARRVTLVDPSLALRME